jgi:hypothetical protein
MKKKDAAGAFFDELRTFRGRTRADSLPCGGGNRNARPAMKTIHTQGGSRGSAIQDRVLRRMQLQRESAGR